MAVLLSAGPDPKLMLGLAGTGCETPPKENGLLAGALPPLKLFDIAGPDELPNENILPPGAGCAVEAPNGLTEL